METSYWARWACNDLAGNLHSLMWPYVLAEGYGPLACQEDGRSSDQGGMMRGIRWSLKGSRWESEPIDLTATCSCSATRTVASFHWRLVARPLPVTRQARTGFEAHLRRQMDRIHASLNQEMALSATDEGIEAAEEGASLQACWECGHDVLRQTPHAPRAGRPDVVGCQGVSAADVRAEWARTRHSRMRLKDGSRCDVCGGTAVPVPGTANRHYCLVCQHHLPRQIAAS
jgi:hypothetical protein